MQKISWLAAFAVLGACAAAPTPDVTAANFMDMSCAELAQSQYNTQIRVTSVTGKFYGDAFKKNYVGPRGSVVAAEKSRFDALNTAISRKGCERPPDFVPVSQTGGTASYWNDL